MADPVITMFESRAAPLHEQGVTNGLQMAPILEKLGFRAKKNRP